VSDEETDAGSESGGLVGKGAASHLSAFETRDEREACEEHN